MKVALVNHGCAKNLVDSELILIAQDTISYGIDLYGKNP